MTNFFNSYNNIDSIINISRIKSICYYIQKKKKSKKKKSFFFFF